MDQNQQQFWESFCREPNDAQFEQVYEGTKRLVYTICRRILLNEEDAGDAFQRAYCRLLAWARHPEEHEVIESIEQLARRLAVREASSLYMQRIRRSRKEVVMAALDFPDSGLAPDQLAANSQLRGKIEALMTTLPERYRLPLLLHYFQGMTHKEIAEDLGKPISTISNNIARGLKKLNPLMRRAGLGESLTAFAAITATCQLLSPPAAMAAPVVFAKANAALAAGGGALTGTAASATLGKTMIGAIAMSTKKVLISAVIVLCVAGIIWQRSKDRSADSAGASSSDQVALEQNSQEQTAENQLSANEQATLLNEKNLTKQSLISSLEETDAPLWCVRIGPFESGEYPYFLLIESKAINDPLNILTMPYEQYAEPFAQDIFSNPPLKPGLLEQLSVFQGMKTMSAYNPQPEEDGRLLFLYQGALTRPAYLIADCLGGPVLRELFVPYNEAARLSQQEIEQDESLGGFRGKVVSAEGKPIEGARISCSHAIGSENDDIYHTAKTNHAGDYFIVGLEPGTYNVSAIADYYLSNSYQKFLIIEAGKNAEGVDIVLEAAGAISGIVVDLEDRPVAGASVMGGGTVWDKPYITGPDGRFEIRGLRIGLHQVNASAEGYGPAIMVGVMVEVERAPTDVTLKLTKGLTVSGRVIQEVYGKDMGVEGAGMGFQARASHKGNAPMFGSDYHIRTRTASDGSFELVGVPSDVDLYVLCSKGRLIVGGGREPFSVMFPSGETPEPMLLRLPGVGGITGTVVDELGLPVAGAKVYQLFKHEAMGYADGGYVSENTKQTVTNSQGKFSLTELEAGLQYTLLVMGDGYANTISEPLNLTVSEEDEVKIALNRGSAISGRVVQGDLDLPLAKVEILAIRTEHELIRDNSFTYANFKTVSADDGSFEFKKLPPGVYAVCGGIPGEKGVAPLIGPALNIAVSEEQSQEVVLRAWPPSNIRGRVVELVNGEERGIDQVRIQCSSTKRWQMGKGFIDEFGLFGEGAYSNAEGEFALLGMLAGDFEIEFKTDVFSGTDAFVHVPSMQISLAVGEDKTGVVQVLSRGGTISGVVVDAEGENALPNVNVRAFVKRPLRQNETISYASVQATGNNGRFTIRGLTLGEEYQVRITPAAAGSMAPGMSVKRGTGTGESEYVLLTETQPEAEVVVPMAKMATIAGRVIDQDGKPAAGIRVRCEITYADGTTDDPLVAVPTNPDGHFQMSVPANHKLSFDAYTFDELNGGHIDLALEANGVANDFLLEAGQEISGVELVLKKK